MPARLQIARPTLELFFTALIAAVCIRVPGSDLLVHLRLAVALGAFALAGAAVELALGLRASRWQAVCLGQLGFGAWFWLRSLGCEFLHLPGVTRVELWLVLAFVLLAVAARQFAARLRAARIVGAHNELVARDNHRELAARFAVLLAWAALLFLFVGGWSGVLAPPSSDPELHVFSARLTMMSGRVAHTFAPFFTEPVRYPSGFSVLDALWAMLSGNGAVATTLVQVAVQGALAIGLVIELGEALSPRLRPVASIACIAVLGALAHWPLGGDPSLSLAGTPRLASLPMLLLPFVLAVRVRAALARVDEDARPWRLPAVAPPLAVWVLLQNPSCVLGLAATAAAGAFVLWRAPRANKMKGDSSAAPRRSPVRVAAVSLGVGLLLSAAILAEDPWVRSRASGVSSAVQAPAPPAGTNAPAEPDPVPQASRPPAPQASPDELSGALLGGLAIPLALALALLAFFRARRTSDQSARPQLDAALAGSGAAVLAMAGLAALALLPGEGEPGFVRDYGRGMLAASAALLALAVLFLLALHAIERAESNAPAGPRRLAALLGAGLLVLVLVRQGAAAADLELSRRALLAPPRGDLGLVTEDDFALIAKVNALVPAGERVLLPSIPAATSRHENWLYPIATSRAAFLAGTFQVAYGYAIGGADDDAASYRRRVCRSFDLEWLAAQGVRWMLISPRTLEVACLHHDGGGPALWEVALHEGDTALLRLRPDALAHAALDGSLHALEAPVATGSASTVRGAAELGGPVGLKGWACAGEGSAPESAPANVELELFAPGGTEPLWHEVRFAAEPSKSGEAAGCGPGHGYAFAPIALRGRYDARLTAISPDLSSRRVLAERFRVSIDY